MDSNYNNTAVPADQPEEQALQLKVPCLSPTGRPVLSDIDDDDRLTDKFSRKE